MDSLALIRRDIVQSVDHVTQVLQERLNCKLGCKSCCVDDLTVFEIEAAHIKRRHGATVLRQAPHPDGACAFLDGDGACRIYEDRPYVCLTQGLPLRWMEPTGEQEVVEYRDICPLNETEQPLQNLPQSSCWLIGPFEGRLAQLQSISTGNRMARTKLRDLFKGNEGSS